MVNLINADAYFAHTLRKKTWLSFDEEQREIALHEAGSMIGRLSFLRTPPTESIDNATYEQAYCLLDQLNDSSEVANAIARGIKSRAIDDASESYASAAERDKDPGWINGVYYCPRALSFFSEYLGTPVRHGRLAVRSWM